MRKFRKLVEPVEGKARCTEMAQLALSAFEPRAFATLCAEFNARSRGTDDLA
jgi:hypothetical protein